MGSVEYIDWMLSASGGISYCYWLLSKVLTPLSDFDSSLMASASFIMLAPLRIGERSWVIVELDELRRPGGLKIVVVDYLTGSVLFFDSLDDFLAFIINYKN